jgi:hypothetical protein
MEKLEMSWKRRQDKWKVRGGWHKLRKPIPAASQPQPDPVNRVVKAPHGFL